MCKYEVKPDGSLGPGTPFTEGPGIGDGMKVDRQGNVYSTSGAGPGIVRVTSPAGKLLGYLNLPIVDTEPKRQICATNIAFGDADGHGLYVTACDAVYRIRLKADGRDAGPEERDAADAEVGRLRRARANRRRATGYGLKTERPTLGQRAVQDNGESGRSSLTPLFVCGPLALGL